MNNVADPSSIKYQVKAKINADGVVDKPDVVGAIFGQTEGLLGDNLDLRDLQKSGRIGRVEVEIVSKAGKSEGIVYMSSSLDQVETAIIAATLETIDRVGPCKASIKVLDIEDVRATKRELIAERAKELLSVLMEQAKGSGSNITQNIRESLQCEEITTYGKERCPAGPAVKSSEAIIIVEGRSDVLNLLRAGIKNAVAVEGTNIPKSVQDLSKERVTTAFVDGDRGGELILRELFQTSDIDYVARAPRAHEVEELSAKQLVKCLRNKVPGDQYMEMNGLSFEERELSETAERDLEEHHVRRNAEDFLKEESEEDAYARKNATDEDEDDEPRYGRNRRERHNRRSSEEDSEDAPVRERRSRRNYDEDSDGRSARRERRSRRNYDEDSDEPPMRERHNRRSSEEDSEDAPVRERRSRRNYDEDSDDRNSRGNRYDRRRRDFERRNRYSEEEDTETEPVKEEVSDEPVTESVVTETDDGKVVIEEVEVKETVEEPAEEAPITEEKTEEPASEPVESVTEPAVEAEVIEEKTEEPASEETKEEEKPKRIIRAPRGRKGKTDKVLTEEQEVLKATLGDISGTRNSVLMDPEGNIIDKVEVKTLANYLKESTAENITTIVFDGVISQNILDIASGKGIKTLVGKNKGKIAKLPAELTVWTRADLM